MTLGGNVCIRDGNQYDYCWRECIRSLLPVCDEVVVCDGQSQDGTQEELREWAKTEPKIKLCVYPWPHPLGNPDFWVDWLNYSRSHLSTTYHIQLDADEVLSEKSYPEVMAHKNQGRHSVFCHRYNFWKDNRHLVPHGVCLGHRVLRIAPTDVWLPSDGPHPNGDLAVSMAQESGIEIFHYGFLRKRAALFDNKRNLLKMFFNYEDKRMTDVEKVPGNWMEEIEDLEWINSLLDYTGEHPKVIQEWLTERGYGP